MVAEVKVEASQRGWKKLHDLAQSETDPKKPTEML